MKLLTIPISHYCEKARWALDHAGLAYQEEGHLPLLHWLAVKRAGGKRTVPVLVKRDGLLTESSDILKWADQNRIRGSRLWPDNDDTIGDWIRRFDKDLGPASRLMGYAALLPKKEHFRQVTVGAPQWEQHLARVGRPLITRMLQKKLGITPARVAKAEGRVRGVLDAVETALAVGHGLSTHGFSAADLTFAALAAPLVFPPEYGGPLPSYASLGPEDRAVADGWRARPAGQFVLQVYAAHRR